MESHIQELSNLENLHISKTKHLDKFIQNTLSKIEPSDRGESRGYVNHIMSSKLDTLVKQFIQKLYYFQTRRETVI